jgi:hypothetical protein
MRDIFTLFYLQLPKSKYKQLKWQKSFLIMQIFCSLTLFNKYKM